MGLQEVKDEILNEAEEKASRIKEEGETEADEIIESAEQEAEQVREEAKEEIEEEKQALKQKEISKAEMDAKKKVQHSRQKSVEEVFKAFEEELNGLSNSQLESFVKNAKDKANFEVEKITGSSEFEEFVDLDFEETEEQGLLLESANGKKSLNLSFERIIEDFKRSYRGEVAEKLFDEVKK